MAAKALGTQVMISLRKAGRQFSTWRPEEPRFLAALVLVLGVPFLLLYWALIKADLLLDRDDIFIVGPLRDVHGVGEYLAQINSGKIFDFLPLRDLSFKANLCFSGVPLLGNFHFTNCAIWALAGLLFFRILKKLQFSSLTILVVMLLFVVHPVFVNTVAWVAARKHILAAFFILWATARVMTGSAGKSGSRLCLQIGLLYFMAVLSQPVVVLWPAWWALYLRLDRKRGWREVAETTLRLAPVLVAALALNWWYYSGPYLRASGGVPKFLPGDLGSLTRYSFHSLGRHFFQLVAPLRVSPMDYEPNSSLNLWGIAMVLVFCTWSAWSKGWQRTVVWFSPFFLVMAVLLVHPTLIFVSDTYLLWPGVSLLVLLAYSLEEAREKISLCVLGLVAAVGLLLLVSLPLTRAWRSMDRVMAYAYETEPTERVKQTYSKQLLGERKCIEALSVALENVNLIPAGRNMLAQIGLTCPVFTPAKMEVMLKQFYIPGLFYTYGLGTELGMEGKNAEAYGLLRRFIPEIGRADIEEFSGFGGPGTMGAEIVFFCESAHGRVDECRRAEREIRARLTAEPVAQLKMDERLTALRKISASGNRRGGSAP